MQNYNSKLKIFNFKLQPLTFNFALLTIILIGFFLRFYNLNWGAPYYFHPDERNIASSVTQLSFPNQMNPHFFAYGSLPIYVIYFTTTLYTFITQLNLSSLNSQFLSFPTVSFEYAIIISRLYSALFSCLILVLIYKIVGIVTNQKAAIFSLFLAVFSTGFIQYAHFGTFEMWLSFFSVLLLYWLIRYIQEKNFIFLFLASITTGALCAIKVSSIILFILPLLTLLLIVQRGNIIKITQGCIVLLVSALGVYLISNPYSVFDFTSFMSSIQYESTVALGTLPVFYTQSFFQTIPVFFQMLFIYPFLLNPLITFFLVPVFFLTIFISFQEKNKSYFLIWLFFSFLFFSQAFLFVKWTRYIVPTLPFIYIMFGIIYSYFQERKHSIKLFSTISFLLIIVSFISSTSFFIAVYGKDDSRIEAAKFANNYFSGNETVLSEVFDLGIVPFNSIFQNITLFNFYDLETDPLKQQELTRLLEKTDIIILPSQRILKSRILNTSLFPLGNTFYTNLLNKQLSFTKVYETSCDIFCKIVYIGNPVWHFEDTTTVFDRPTVFIFKRIKNNELGIKD